MREKKLDEVRKQQGLVGVVQQRKVKNFLQPTTTDENKVPFHEIRIKRATGNASRSRNTNAKTMEN